MYAPAQHDEVTGLVNHIDEQLTAIRAAAFGLTEEQARQTPCRSALSVGGATEERSRRLPLQFLRTHSPPAPATASRLHV